MDEFKKLGKFMADRHRIYLKRAAGDPPPWTMDKVLREGHFCNIFRELDRVTIWIRKNIREVYADHPNLWFMLAIARYINWPETLVDLIATPGAWPDSPDFTPEKLTRVLEQRAEGGLKVYTGAYMIRAESDPSKPWYSWTKHRYISEIVLGRVWERRSAFEKILNAKETTQEAVFNLFQDNYFMGWGPFMAYEVITDLRHTKFLCNAPDIYSWANAGPGAIRGLNRLYGRALKYKPSPSITNDEMQMLMEELNNTDMDEIERVFGTVAQNVKPRFEMRDIEHSLCEYDKYIRVSKGEGKMRSKYNYATVRPLEE